MFRMLSANYIIFIQRVTNRYTTVTFHLRYLGYNTKEKHLTAVCDKCDKVNNSTSSAIRNYSTEYISYYFCLSSHFELFPECCSIDYSRTVTKPYISLVLVMAKHSYWPSEVTPLQ